MSSSLWDTPKTPKGQSCHKILNWIWNEMEMKTPLFIFFDDMLWDRNEITYDRDGVGATLEEISVEYMRAFRWSIPVENFKFSPWRSRRHCKCLKTVNIFTAESIPEKWIKVDFSLKFYVKRVSNNWVFMLQIGGRVLIDSAHCVDALLSVWTVLKGQGWR